VNDNNIIYLIDMLPLTTSSITITKEETQRKLVFNWSLLTITTN
jgi:hypothetical protein